MRKGNRFIAYTKQVCKWKIYNNKKKSAILKVVFDAVQFKKIVQCSEHSKWRQASVKLIVCIPCGASKQGK